ncbi:glycosyltransferase [Halomonas denitrificans]|uniref:glycosyltransferase n=1 Tax=Halomonas denitrificans TaxID=370769 RepID=UPI001CD1E2C4|nr:glycosyltransferase [Halomonas denitrificans]MCA0976442.1 glycosyltransferase [Halomonas denitrificans]
MQNVLVIMSVYNEELDEIMQAIQSILNQKSINLDLLVVVDNPDIDCRVLQFIAKVEAETENCFVKRNPRNIGIAESLNRAIPFVRSRAIYSHIARMDADDISKENRLQKQLQYMSEHPAIDLVGCSATLIDESGSQIGSYDVPEVVDISYGTLCIHPTWLMKVEMFIALDGYRPYSCSQDYDFLCRAVISGFKIRNVPEKLFNYRIRDKSIGNRKKLEQRRVKFFISRSFRRGDLLQRSVPELSTNIWCKCFDKVEAIKSNSKFLGRIVSVVSYYHWVSLYYVAMRKLTNY